MIDPGGLGFFVPNDIVTNMSGNYSCYIYRQRFMNLVIFLPVLGINGVTMTIYTTKGTYNDSALVFGSRMHKVTVSVKIGHILHDVHVSEAENSVFLLLGMIS